MLLVGESIVSLLCLLSQGCLATAKELLEKRLILATASNFSQTMSSLKEIPSKTSPNPPEHIESQQSQGRNSLIQHVNQLFDLTIKRRQVSFQSAFSRLNITSFSLLYITLSRNLFEYSSNILNFVSQSIERLNTRIQTLTEDEERYK